MDYYLNASPEVLEEDAPADASSSDEDGENGEGSVRVVLCDAAHGSMDYYLKRAWERPESVGGVLQQIAFLMDNSEMAETPWRMTGANLQDYFNFNLDEKSLKEALLRQVRLRLEARKRRKLGVADGGASPRPAERAFRCLGRRHLS